MIKKMSIDKLLFFLMLIFPVSTIMQGLPFFSYINKILIGITIVLLFFKTVIKKITIPKVIVLSITGVLYVFSIIFTNWKLQQINDLFYFGFWILYFMYMVENNDEFIEVLEKNMPAIIGVTIFWNLLVFISLFFPNSFILKGSTYYFQSFSNGFHRFASTSIFILIMNLIIIQKKTKKRYWLLFLIPYITTFLTGARIYLALVILIGLSVIYCMTNTKIKLIVFSIIFLFVSAGLVFITPMGQKFITSKNIEIKEENYATKQEKQEGVISKESEQQIAINSITSGRTLFWKADIKGYLVLNPLKKLVGNGYNYVYDINEKAIHDRIWAHNDFINPLLSNGLIGLILYLYVFIKYCYIFCKTKKIPLLLISFVAFYFFNAMFNMVYTYMCCVLVIPFVLYAFSLKNSNNKYIKRSTD